MSNDYNIRAKSIINPANQVGVIQKEYGKGEQLVVRLWDTFVEDLDKPLWVEIDSLPVPLFMGSFQPQGRERAIIMFEDFETPEKAAMLVGLKLYGEYIAKYDDDDPWEFLVGYTFHDTTSGKQGKIVNFIDNQINPLIEVEIDGDKYLLPIAEELVDGLDEQDRIIVMSQAEGIFEI